LLCKQVLIASEPLLLTKQSFFLSVQLPYSLLSLFSVLTCLSYSIFSLYRSITVLIQLCFVSPLMLTVLHVCCVFSSIETSRGKERFVTCIKKLTALWNLPWKLLKTVGNTSSATTREYCKYPFMLVGLKLKNHPERKNKHHKPLATLFSRNRMQPPPRIEPGLCHKPWPDPIDLYLIPPPPGK
jgi:hypothetical protein